jgi:phage gpG-like protein
MSQDTVDTKTMVKIEKMFGQDFPQILIGIMGEKAQRKDEDKLTNADIGLVHEFGTENIPQRSFLMLPLQEKFDQYVKKSGIMSKNTLKEIVKEGGLESLAKKLALIAERVVLDAFDTGGFGQWPPSNMKNKKVQQTLVETQQLRDSITTKVVA